MTHAKSRLPQVLVVLTVLCLSLASRHLFGQKQSEPASLQPPATPEQQAAPPHGQTNQGVPRRATSLAPEQAFRKAILSLKDRVDFFNTNGVITFHRTADGTWFLLIRDYPGLPLGGIWMSVSDDGTIKQGHAF